MGLERGRIDLELQKIADENAKSTCLAVSYERYEEERDKQEPTVLHFKLPALPS